MLSSLFAASLGFIIYPLPQAKQLGTLTKDFEKRRKKHYYFISVLYTMLNLLKFIILIYEVELNIILID